MSLDKNKLRLVRKTMEETFKENPLQLVQYMGLVQVMDGLKAKYGSNSKIMNFITKAGPCWAFTEYDNKPFIKMGLRHNIKALIQDYNNILKLNEPDNVKRFLIDQYIYWHKNLKTGKFSMKPNNKIKNDFIKMQEDVYRFKKKKDNNSSNSSGNNNGNDDIDNLIAKLKKTSNSGNDDDSNNDISFSKKKKHHHNHDPQGPEMS